MNKQNLGVERRLIFGNFANGVDIEELMVAFHRSRLEVERDIMFVVKKITEYRFRRCTAGNEHASPPVQCDTLADIRVNRLALFDTLRRLGDNYLSSELLLPKVNIQKIDHPAMAAEAFQRLNAA